LQRSNPATESIVSIHVALNHVTDYKYDRPISLSPQIVRLRPAPHARTPIVAYSLKVTPAEHFINWQQDPQSNYLARLVFPERTSEFRVEVDLVAELAVINPFDFFLEPQAEKFPFKYDEAQARELAPYLVKLPGTPRFNEYLLPIAQEAAREPRRSVDFLVDLNHRLQQDIRYLIRLEPGVQTPEETLACASGSCRDSAWLLVQLARHLGLAARFVSGYLIQLTPDVKSLDGPSGPARDFTDLHAWAEVYLPGAGWIGLDPTSGLFAGEGHIPLACTPEPTSAAPVTGLTEKCETEFVHSMRVERIWEAPRVTKPYSETQWLAIESLGHEIDAELDAGDVRLTMGGEPTFVSVDDHDGAEWNTDALGPTKRGLAASLLARLKGKYAPQGFLHYGQGKWYPGEQLPRWSLGCWWRCDGEPMWNDPALFADEKIDYGVTAAQAARFLQGVAQRLGVTGEHILPAHEDVWYYLWRERRLPANVDPFDARLDDPMERERLRKVFSQGLDKVVGYVFPIAHSSGGPGRWQSGPWFLRGERLYLLPGDSPLGFRLPLDSLPWTRAIDHPYLHAPDLTQVFPALPRHGAIRQLLQTAQPPHKVSALNAALEEMEAQRAARRAPAPFESASWIVRTALCAEPRNGVLYLFMPPVDRLEDYLELVAACEDTARDLGQPVLFEGYEPPRDPRLDHIRVTPDPGVIEVNIHAAHGWDELVDHTTHLYEAAHESRLSTEKFMLDGRHTGTGGGNHFVLGGATTLDSPFLRRPDLLKSLVAYWHNHPSLSYLFSGLFIGPTCQAPRVDEARNDALHELEIAFRQFPQVGDRVQPWLVDRLMRNLLIDVTGNTHRAEFCIDKLYSPDGPAGRLGLLEMRAFEMPPHARMSLTQQLLLRALVARFWKQPYAPQRLQRWGTELHDRYLLPHFVGLDFDDVITEMNQAGYPLEREWFAPHFEFRFPFYGDFTSRGVHVELRQALEPWNVMGEEGAAGGTARYVDSSVERVQVHVTGLIGDRHVVACNGRAVPLQPTGTVGEYVAGVRYRAWQPASALHPTIPVHAPLVFDLVDSWMNRSLGGCQYHVSHPGGRSFEVFPVNAYEAEARRRARFFRMGHTPGGMSVAPPQRDPEFPFTLDLRRG
jgi:uncharacterized protein (DUF2126 family)